MTWSCGAALAALIFASPALAQAPAPPPITAPTADPSADAELVACVTYLAADNTERMQMLAELEMMANEGGGKTSANEIAADLATECEARPNSLISDVLAAMTAR